MKDFDQLAGQPTVVIGGNDAATLAGLRVALEGDGVAIAAQVTSAQELIDAVESVRPDVCLIDAGLKGGAIGAAAEVAARTDGVAVVLLADEPDGDSFLSALRVGVSGYIPKGIEPARLASVVRAVVDGEAAIPRGLVSVLVDQYRNRPVRRRLAGPSGRIDLTSREWEVLDLIREGLSTRQIADRLVISEVTVRRHASSVLRKLHVPSRAAALRLLESA